MKKSHLSLCKTALLLISLGLALSNGYTRAAEAKGLSISELKLYLQFSTALNCQERAAGQSLYQSLRQSAKAFAVILEKKNQGNLENSQTKMSTQQAQNFFANETAIQMLSACPSRLSPSELNNIKAMQQELNKRRQIQTGKSEPQINPQSKPQEQR